MIAAHPAIRHWVVSGHSLGGALAARLAQSDAGALSALVLIGTTHPKENDLSVLRIPVTARWVEIRGGNHSQFGRYGHQLFDGAATFSRDEQESITRAALLEALAGVATR